jgi:hypothetical protein
MYPAYLWSLGYSNVGLDVSDFLCSRRVALTRVTDEAISVQHCELIHRQLPLTR